MVILSWISPLLERVRLGESHQSCSEVPAPLKDVSHRLNRAHIRRVIGTREREAYELLGEASRNVGLARERRPEIDLRREVDGGRVISYVVEAAGGIDWLSARVGRAVATNRIEVLEREPSGVDQLVARAT